MSEYVVYQEENNFVILESVSYPTSDPIFKVIFNASLKLKPVWCGDLKSAEIIGKTHWQSNN